MDKEDLRKQYWNEQYSQYWQSRVNEAGKGNSGVILGDTNTEEDWVYADFFAKHGFNNGNILEVGCAWGRMFPLYTAHNLRVSGVDISHAMIAAAKKNWLSKDSIADIHESPAEKLPFPDMAFDNLACIATFDATYQNQAIHEFLRVTKPGARIYFTGKNDYYETDDHAAMAAEIGARNKKHPNYFTDTKYLVELLKTQGHQIEALYCFRRRGDFAAAKYAVDMPERFYEFLLIVKRGENCAEFPVFSNEYSRTFLNLNK